MDVIKPDGPRNGHTSRHKLLKRFFNQKHAYLSREILNPTFDFKSNFHDSLNRVKDDLLEFYEDGMYQPTSEDPERAQNQYLCMEYSLNKRKRWLIPEAVQTHAEALADEDFRVVVYERKVASKGTAGEVQNIYWANCVGYEFVT